MTQVTLTATFTAAGPFTWVAPAGVTSVVVACTGAGGGGGNAGPASGSNGGGGGGGEAALEPALAVTPSLAYSGTVGTGGAAAVAGTDTFFTGDAGVQVYAHGGKAGGNGGAAGNGPDGPGGTGSTNSVSASGGNGDSGTSATNGGGGGGAAGVSTSAGFPGNPGSGSTAGAASGGTYPGGAGGAGNTTGTGGGTAGSAPGGGGGGALSTGTGRAGGAGANGQVTITWTQTDPVTLAFPTTGGAYAYTAPPGATSVTAQAWGAGASGYNAVPTGNQNAQAGATIWQVYGFGSTNRIPMANTFDGYTGIPMALQVQKVFFNETGGDSIAGFVDVNHPQQVGDLLAAGCYVILCVKPNRAYGTTDDFTALQNALTAITSAYPASMLSVVLWMECNLNDPSTGSGFFPSTAAYLAYWNHYAPAVPSNVRLLLDPGMAQEARGIAYAQAVLGSTVRVPDAIGVDWYGSSWNNGVFLTYPTSSPKYPGIFDVADTAGVPAGVFEYGASAQAGYFPTPAEWNSYIGGTNGLATVIAARQAANKPMSHVLYYGGSGPGNNDIETGAVTPGTIPNSGQPVTNSTGAAAYVTITGGSVSSVLINGATATPVNGFYTLPAGGTIAVTYTGTLAWAWYSDFRVPGLTTVYNLMMGGQAQGGAGGGGGEFAQESSLAIVGGTSYAVTVGQGGGPSPGSGGSSTVAGQSVTVTANGGSVATSQGTGGTGGTGSTNSTHHNGGAGGAGGGSGGGGGGGGGSAGTAAGGNTGSAGTVTAGGAGGTAVTGGAAGGGGVAPGSSGFPGGLPGAGGGGNGANGLNVGDGGNGQITLSGFTTHPSAAGGLGLAPLALSATCFTGSASGGLGLAPPALAGTADVAMFNLVQTGAKASGTGSCVLPLTSASTGTASSPHLIEALVVTNSQVAFTAPAGWQRAAFQNAGGGNGRIERWYYLDTTGGVTSATFTATGGGDCRGYLSEWSCPAGYSPVLDGTPGTASGTSGTSLPVSTPGSAAGADLLLAGFLDEFSSSTSGQSWTTPPGWTPGQSTSTGVRDNFAGYSQPAPATGTQSVTGTFSTTTNQTGWAAVLVAFTAVPLNTCTGGVALAPLALAGTAASVVPPTVVATSGGLQLAPLAVQSPSRAATFGQGGNSVLPILIEILINGVWTDITSYAYQRNPIQITSRGRPNEASTVQPMQCAITLNNRDGSFSPQNTAGQFYPYLVRNTQLRVSVVNAVTPLGAWYTGYRFWGEVPAWPPRWDPTGTDAYVTITAAGVLQRMNQNKTFGSPLARYYATLAASGQTALVPAGYWTCEDAAGSSSFASGIPGGSPMTWSGGTGGPNGGPGPGLAGDSNIPGSNPVATTSGSAWTGAPGAFSAGGITYDTPGTYQWLCPAGVTSILAECWGAGGGGSNGIFGTGGGGGEYAAEPALAVTPGTLYTLTVGAGGPGAPGGPAPGYKGAPGGNSIFSGDSVTVTAHGGGGGPNAGSGHASGGSGSRNTTHHSGGSGAANGGYGGGGGGSSGGNAAAGNSGTASAGTAGAAGGAVVIDGGPGGTGGNGALASEGNTGTPGLMPFPGPGGGGGGGGFNGGDNFGLRGGGGQAGQVRISFGATPAPPATVLRAAVDVPSTGGVEGAYLGEILTTGTVALLHIKYHTANGGSLELIGHNAGGSTIISSGIHTFAVNGQPMLISAELTQKTAGTVAWKLTAITPGATAVVATYTGTVSGTLGSVTAVNVNNDAGFTDTGSGIGHVSVQYAVDPILNLAPALAAYAGELAAVRFLRLCGQQNIPALLVGETTDTPQMGVQTDQLLSALLQECETADAGLLFEPRTQFGLGYTTRISMQNQSPDVILSYPEAQLAQGLEPTDDEVLTRNDILATRANGGSSYEAALTSGPMSTADPPDGVGSYAFPVSVNLYSDEQLANFAGWLLTLGTLDEFRWPSITIDLARSQVADGTFGQVAGLDIASFLQIVYPTVTEDVYSDTYSDVYGEIVSAPPPWLPPPPVSQLCFGFTETLNALTWVIAVNTVPEDPYTSPPGQQLPTW